MKIKIVIIILLIVLILPVLYIQLIKPMAVKPKKVECVTWDATFVGIQTQAQEVANGEYNKNKVIIHSFKDKLPSKNPNDYMTIYCTLDVNNRSFFNIKSIEAYVQGLGDYSQNILFSYSSSEVVSSGVWRFSNEEITFRLDLYLGNMKEEAVRDMVKGIKAKVLYEGDFIGIREEVVNFSNCKNVTVEFGK